MDEFVKKLTSEEFKAWHTERGLPWLGDKIIKEMEDEGLEFELRKTKNGKEYPFINSANWVKESARIQR